ncbi:hypothetical protein J437_LFUL018236, partial [Ladona fulva]
MQQIVYTGDGDLEVGGAGHLDCVVMKLLENPSVESRKVALHGKNRRNNPKDVTEAKLRRNEYICRWTDDGICVWKWKDKRDILMISSEHGAEFTSVKSGRGTEREKPNIILIKMVNSFKLFDSCSGTKKTLSEFRLEVIGELVSSKEYLSLAKRFPEKFLHFPRYLPFMKESKKRQQKRCRECYKKNLIKKTITYCRDCVDEPGLCMEPCFLMYHGRDP